MIDSKFFYSNSLQVQMTLHDFSLRFMRAGSLPKEEVENFKTPVESKPRVLEELVVAMSPSHAKAMIPSLIQIVQLYESKFGKIAAGPDVEARWEQMLGSRVTKS